MRADYTGFVSCLDYRTGKVRWQQPVHLVQGHRCNVTLLIDSETNLLRRLVRYSESPVGRLVTRVDYHDYRQLAGVKIPSRWTVSWLSGRSQFELTDIQPNAQIPADRFARPNLPQTLFP